MKKAVCVGINDYPGSLNDLRGCVNDARDWSALLAGMEFDVSLLLDSQATRTNVKAALQGFGEPSEVPIIRLCFGSNIGRKDLVEHLRLHLLDEGMDILSL